IFFGVYIDKRFPATKFVGSAKAIAISVTVAIATVGGLNSNATAIHTTAISKARTAVWDRFFATTICRNRTGEEKYSCNPVPSVPNVLYTRFVSSSREYPAPMGNARSGVRVKNLPASGEPA